jgi:endonuclease/exonuclease/phosphatase family metal-dependent hydrolase
MWIALLMVVETIMAFFDFIYGILAGENFSKELKFVPTRTFICILLRELVAMGAVMDVARGVPIVHMNFLGYDEQAHRRGPSTKFAHRALRGIDKIITKIYWQAMHSTRRNYDVWIYSDHGQEDSESYITKYGRTVRDAVTSIYQEFESSSGTAHPGEPRRKKYGFVSTHDRQGVESHRARYINGGFIRWLFSVMGISYADEEAHAEAAKGRIVVTAIGSTGNIYLPREMTPQERDRFAQKLVQDAGIPVVLAPEGAGRVKAWREDGEFSLPEQAGDILGKNHPFLRELTQDLISLCHHPQGGAFTFMGWRPGSKPLTFPIENGAHAGPGTEETNAFCLLPADIISALDDPGYLSTQDLRTAALSFIGRKVPESPVGAAPPAARPETIRTLSVRQKAADFNPWMNGKSLLAQDSAQRAVQVVPGISTRWAPRIMTYNVHSCVGMDGKISPERIARVIGQHRPDIVALQELDLKRKRTGGMDQTHIIAKALEMIYHFHSNIGIEEESYGSAVLSRYPMQMIKSGELPGLAHKPRLEPRGAIWCAIDLGGRTLHFINTHLGLRREERLAQARALCGPQWLEHPDCQGPVILSGDFNALPHSPVCRHIRQKLKDVQIEMNGHVPQATWFSHMPMGRIDHVFVSPDIEIVCVEVSSTDLERRSSDHLPLIVDVRLGSHLPSITL